MVSISTKVQGVGNYITNSEFWNSTLLPLIKGNWKNLVQKGVNEVAQKIPVKYYKIIGIGSGALVALSPVIFRFIKKKHWVFYVILGVAEIFTAFFLQNEREHRRIIVVQ
ncbi:MAG TPA: hypothetical protein VNW99_04640 [Cytophagaceae bacterium]|jgi:hypothetical protein|nr:hypothetical protein [Cytophagaceae bacterium]